MHFITKLLKKIFNRTTVCVIGILLQLTYLVVIFLSFGTQYTYSYFAFVLLGVILSLYIYNMDINPSYKMAWMFSILSFPIFVVMFYVFFGNSHSGDRLRKRMTQYNDEARLLLPQNNELMSAVDLDNTAAEKQAKYLYNYGGYPVYANTKTTYFPIGEAKFSAMIEELEKAQRFVFLEYFIVAEGKMWGTILNILERKVKEGVDVRMIYDDIGCLFTLPYKYNEILEEKGIKCRVFNQFRPIWSAKMNNRDHRKIFVVDGYIGFTGGINLADEYINKVKRFGYWKDTGVRIEGEAVWSLTAMFLEMWNYINRSTEDYSRFLPSVYREKEFTSDGFVQPYGDSPLDNENVGENIYLNIINRAKNYVYIFTPYLIIDHEMLICLSNAAKSGVDVRIVTPGVPDKKAVYLLTQSYYEPLLKNGVKIFQYTPGFIHAKCFVCDDEIATVGSVNLDYRSLFLHFECGVFMYRSKAVMQVKEDCLRTFEESEEMDVSFCRRRRLPVRMVQSLMRLFAPLL